VGKKGRGHRPLFSRREKYGGFSGKEQGSVSAEEKVRTGKKTEGDSLNEPTS